MPELRESRKTVDDAGGNHDDDLPAHVTSRAQRGRVKWSTHGNVAVSGDQHHHPDGHQLDNVRHRPRQDLVVRVDALQVLELAADGRHCRVHLDGGGCRQENVVADSQRFEEVGGHRLTSRCAARTENADRQAVADQSEDADEAVQRPVDGHEEPRVVTRNAPWRIDTVLGLVDGVSVIATAVCIVPPTTSFHTAACSDVNKAISVKAKD